MTEIDHGIHIRATKSDGEILEDQKLYMIFFLKGLYMIFNDLEKAHDIVPEEWNNLKKKKNQITLMDIASISFIFNLHHLVYTQKWWSCSLYSLERITWAD